MVWRTREASRPPRAHQDFPARTPHQTPHHRGEGGGFPPTRPHTTGGGRRESLPTHKTARYGGDSHPQHPTPQREKEGGGFPPTRPHTTEGEGGRGIPPTRPHTKGEKEGGGFPINPTTTHNPHHKSRRASQTTRGGGGGPRSAYTETLV